MAAHPPLSVRVSARGQSAEEPMSPSGRIMEDMGVYIVVLIGLGAPVNLAVFCAGIETEVLTRSPRFRSIQILDEAKGGRPRWVETMVNLDHHIIVPNLDPSAVACDPETAVEDYVSSLSTLPMDMHRPPWEFHILDIPTSQVTSTVILRMHHSIGDGSSIISLLMASSRSTADPARLPAMPPPPRRIGTIYQRPPRPPLSSGKALLVWVWSYLMLAWNTLVDGVLLVATLLFLSDPRTLFMRADYGSESHRRKRFVHRSLNLDDVKLIKTVMNCTINDALVGVTSAALSQYYFRKSNDIKTKRICLRSFVLVSTRPVSSRQTYVTKVDTGNGVSCLICPFHIALHDDPLEYVRKAKKIMGRKKSSLAAMLTKVVSDFLVKYFGPKIGTFISSLFMARTTIILSNIIGPAEHITFCGHPVVLIALSVYGQPQAMTVHYLNYGSTIRVILALDDEQFPDCQKLLDDFSESVRIIKNAAALKISNDNAQQ
ncbi:unnamed protein product [Alopecurus aequalis]